jgi:colanic acid biosynthesis protein WcaH
VWLPHPDLARVVELTPLVAVDLVVRDGAGRMLIGLRSNRPARGTWFVPGGRVGKNERLAAAFARISRGELGRELAWNEAHPLGVFEHFYDDNFAGEPHFGTHYVVLAYALAVDPATLALPAREQHGGYLWLSDEEILARPDVHPNSQAYCGR